MPPAGSRSDGLAERLLAARSEHQPITALEPQLVPTSVADAYAVDDAVAASLGRPVLGWKIGCTSEHARQVLGADGPMSGRVYDVVGDGAEIGPETLLSEALLEGEIAFTLANDLPAIGHDRSRCEVIEAVATVHPAIEIVGGRMASFIGTPLPVIVADAGGNSLLVLGAGHERFDPAALPEAAATMEIDGEITGSGRGADVLGDPIEALRWLVNHLSSRGIGLSAGQVVTTGTATQISSFAAGTTATATIEGLGSVRLTRPAG